MAIEIRELIIKVKVEENPSNNSDNENLMRIKESVLKACKKEIKRELNKKRER